MVKKKKLHNVSVRAISNLLRQQLGKQCVNLLHLTRMTKQEYRIRADAKISLQILSYVLLLLQYLSRDSHNHMPAFCENTKIGILDVERVKNVTGSNFLDVE